MATTKKDRLSSTLNNIMNRQESREDTEPQEQTSGGSATSRAENDTQRIAEMLNLSPEQTEKVKWLRQQGSGRPKGSRSGEGRPRPNRATFIIPKELTRKLKYIGLVDMRLYKDVVEEALTKYVRDWEDKNGDILLK